MLTRPLRAGPRTATPRLLSSGVVALTVTAMALGLLGYTEAASGAETPQASEEPPRYESAALRKHDDSEPYTAEELEQLVGPVALYPDELMAVVLAASTYPLQIVQAARFLEKYQQDESLEPDEEWDESVLALLNYPEVVELMNDDLNWTWQLGEAVADQQEDVMDAVQDFRGKARAAGNLETNEKMVVEEQLEEGERVIIIESSSTEVIYVPVYQPSTVVVYHSYPYPYWYSYPYPYYYHRHAVFWTGARVGAGVAFRVGWSRRGYSSIRVNRNVNVNINNPGGGGPSGGNRPGGGDRPGGGNRPETKPASGGEKWNADRSPGSQSGGRPGQSNRDRAGTRPSAGTGGGDRAASRPSQGAGGADRASTRPSQGGSGDRAANRSSQTGSTSRAGQANPRSGSGGGHSSSSRGSSSYGSYESRSASRGHSSRGSASRGRAGGGGRGGGRR